MRKLVFGFCFLFISGSSLAQLKSYNISEFLYPDVSRTTFSISPDIFFSSSNSSVNTSENPKILDVRTYASRSHVINTRKKQNSNSLQLNSGYDAIISENEDYKKFYGGWNYTMQNRYFYKERRFIEFDFSSSTSFNERAFLRSNEPDEFFTANRFSPKVGWGRIENISDGWHAWSILNALEQQEKLAKELTSEEIDQFGFELARIKNLRNPDFRIENIMEFQSLMEFIVDHGIIKKDDYAAIALIRDGFNYEQFVSRRQGKSFKIGVDTYLQRSKHKFSEEDFSGYNNHTIIAEYENRKAIKNIFQFDQLYSIKGGVWNFKPESQEEFNKFKYVELTGSLSLGYYLNQRTNLSLRTYASYRAFENSEGMNLYVGSSLNAYYYVSPQLRYDLSADLNIYEYSDGAFIQTEFYSSNINMGISYFIR